MSVTIFLILGIFFSIGTYLKRHNILFFSFSAVFVIMFFIFPLISYSTGYLNGSSKNIFAPVVVYACSFFIPIYLIPEKRRIIIYGNINLVHVRRAILCCFVVGIGLKYVSGGLGHSSVFASPFNIPFLYGISDKIYYLGVGFLMLGIIASPKKRDYIIVLVFLVLLFGLLGSRISIMIPIIFVLFTFAGEANFRKFLLLALFGFVVMFAIIIVVGYWRVDPESRIYVSSVILDTVMFRAFEFQWPLLLIQDLMVGIVSFEPNIFFKNLTAIVPRLSNLVLGYSIFGYDTRVMAELGYARLHMSVPMTPLGEAFLFAGYYGLVVYGFLTGLFLTLLDRYINSYKTYRHVLAMEMFRSVITLNSGTFADVLSLVTKDLILAVLLFNIFMVLARGKRSL